MSFVSLWFVPLTRLQDCILEYILPTKPKRALSVISEQLSVSSYQLEQGTGGIATQEFLFFLLVLI
ncbi:hypothetical protein MICAE_1090010 [Microcystis aeruginosa PCC 9806]|uniref:Uncharacterized protein n=1 Tax=Microcystis aeruginosa PCC 9806 TaxID=1160282 RepID=I4GQL8_MICAE|nr:hypothetical protein MICAE_1090010 [Microcystis aeruginosa PCC 9806]